MSGLADGLPTQALSGRLGRCGVACKKPAHDFKNSLELLAANVVTRARYAGGLQARQRSRGVAADEVRFICGETQRRGCAH
jgi:hypothetical protein